MSAASQCGTLEMRKNSFGRELADAGGGSSLVRGGRLDLGDPGGTRRGDLGGGGARDLGEAGGARARGTSTFRSLPRNNSQLEVRTPKYKDVFLIHDPVDCIYKAQIIH